jgi:hypothetical protein
MLFFILKNLQIFKDAQFISRGMLTECKKHNTTKIIFLVHPLALATSNTFSS